MIEEKPDQTGPSSVPCDELLRALNILHWHFSYDLRLLIPKMLSEASPPILVKLNPDGKTFLRPVSQLQSAMEAAEPNASGIGSGAGARPAADSGGKLDLEALAREGAEQVKRHFGVEDLGALTQIFREPLQQAEAAARDETILHWEKMYEEMWDERDQARAEVERLRVENDMFRERSKYNRQVISSALSKFGIALAAESGGKPGIGDAANQFSEMLSGCRAERDELRAEVERLNARASADE